MFILGEAGSLINWDNTFCIKANPSKQQGLYDMCAYSIAGNLAVTLAKNLTTEECKQARSHVVACWTEEETSVDIRRFVSLLRKRNTEVAEAGAAEEVPAE